MLREHYVRATTHGTILLLRVILSLMGPLGILPRWMRPGDRLLTGIETGTGIGIGRIDQVEGGVGGRGDICSFSAVATFNL